MATRSDPTPASRGKNMARAVAACVGLTAVAACAEPSADDPPTPQFALDVGGADEGAGAGRTPDAKPGDAKGNDAKLGDATGSDAKPGDVPGVADTQAFADTAQVPDSPEEADSPDDTGAPQADFGDDAGPAPVDVAPDDGATGIDAAVAPDDDAVPAPDGAMTADSPDAPAVPDGADTAGDAMAVPDAAVDADPPIPCAGKIGLKCPVGKHCNVVGCGADLGGVCVVLPATCPGTGGAPVCSCNGVTYPSDCARIEDGAAKASDGKCNVVPLGTPCGGVAGIKCGAGQACDVTGCGADVMGKCVAVPPQPCPGADGKSQVCGCDAKTYASDCHRLTAGVAKKGAGPCPPLPSSCVVGGPVVCPAGLYCKAAAAYQCGGAGTCGVQGQVCPLVLKPVCGCDSKSYGNACQAAAAAQNVKAEGACPTGGGGPCTVGGAVVCKAMEYCKASLSGACSGAGTCALKPTTCTPPNATVCGCDGKHYASACSAAVGGVNVAKTGTCPLVGKPCSTGGVPCYQAYWCKAAVANTCGGVGTCAVKPSSCTTTAAPVCGCNDKTYVNVCEATKALQNTKAATACTGGGSGAVCMSAKQCQAGEGCMNAKCALCPGWTCPAVPACALSQKKDPCTCKCYLP